MVEDLRRLLTSSSQQERPLMFVGSELGSMIARFYTQIYQEYLFIYLFIYCLTVRLAHSVIKIFFNLILKWRAVIDA